MGQGGPRVRSNESARARALARLKVLAGTTATGVVVACGYGVVDPLPAPTCFQSPRPTATAKFVEAPPGQEAVGVRFVEITITFAQTDGSTLSNATAREAGGSGASLDVASQSGRAGAYVFVVRVPERVKTFTAQLSSACPEATGRMNLTVIIDEDDVINVSVYSM